MKRRVAILGSGQAALTAAFQLTHPANPKAGDVEVTVYQYGWRLGGKGATGRNPAFGHRIEEHGLHNWFGFYDNSFRQIRDCYGELERAPDAPLGTWQAAFEPANTAVFTEHIDGQYFLWEIENPPNDEVPGDPGLLLPLWEYVVMALEMMWEEFHPTEYAHLFTDESPSSSAVRSTLDRIEALGVDLHGLDHNEGARLLRAIGLAAAIASDRGKLPTQQHGRRVKPPRSRRAKPSHDRASAPPRERHPEPPRPSRIADLFARALDHAPGFVEHSVEALIREVVVVALEVFMGWLWRRVEPAWKTDADLRHLWILANLFYAVIVGSIKDGVITHGFDAINDYNFRDWIKKHAFNDGGIMLHSPVMNAVYDSSFAYINGDMSVPAGCEFPPAEAYEAGTALRGMVRAGLTYKGAFGWRFRAGTGDTCYAPMYEVLEKRGVRFEFFHMVQALELGDGPGTPVQRIRVAQQVELKQPYAPFIDVKGLPCWPNAPLWDQIVDAERYAGVNLECPPPDFVPAAVKVLERGVDFDDVVLGISVAALPSLCPELVAASAKWRAMLDAVKTTRTQALQVWSRRTATQWGFPVLGRPIASFPYGSAAYLNVWGDLSELIPYEAWPLDHYPLNLAYFTSAMADDPIPPPSPLPLFPDGHAQDKVARANAVTMLQTGVGVLWKSAWRGGQEGHFHWDALVDPRPGHHEGEARLDAQYYRANVTPTERYVLSVPGSSKHRLPAHDPDEFANLYLAGDWTWCNLNSGCMEAATMSGMLCSLAMTGFPTRADITGVDF